MPDDEPSTTHETDDRTDAGVRWDAAAILRSRTETARRQQDDSIADLRSAVDDEQIRDALGIDLSAIADPQDDVDTDADPNERESEP